MIDQRRMPDGVLQHFEWRFLEDSGVERAPTRVLAVGHNAIGGTQHAPVRLPGREDGARVHRATCAPILQHPLIKYGDMAQSSRKSSSFIRAALSPYFSGALF